LILRFWNFAFHPLIEGTPQGRQHTAQQYVAAKANLQVMPKPQTGVAFSLATFILAKQKKVVCCRATPGDVDFDLA